MIKHIVMWRIKPEYLDNKLEVSQKIKTALEELVPQINSLDSVDVGINFNPSDAAFDICLTSTHPNKEGLQQYQQHPAHQQAAKYIKSVVNQRAVVDYEC